MSCEENGQYRTIEAYQSNKLISDKLRPFRIYLTSIYQVEWPVQSKKPRHAECRAIVAWIARTKYAMSFAGIAAVCGWEEHSAARHAVRRVGSNPEIAAKAASLYEKYKGAA